MASQSTQSLPEAIRRYGEVAEMVNHREMNRFIEEIRSRWAPLSHEEDYRFEGWTDEGALTKCIYQQAFYYHDQPQPYENPNATEAEENGQVQIKPSLKEIVNFVAKPLILPPLSENRRQKLLENVKIGMSQQVMASGVDASALELPKDLEILFTIVKGINGAGVPAETAYTKLVYAFEGNFPPDKMPLDISLRCKESGRQVPVAALHLGGCEQHRSIYYVLSQLKSSTEITSKAKWQVWGRIDIEVEYYDNLAEWLEHETKQIEETKGGARRELIVAYDRYPV